MRLFFSSACLWVASSTLLFVSGCNNESPRRYSEIGFRAKSGPMASTEAPVHISWTLPQDWVEQPGGDPLRVASFLAPDSSTVQNGEMDPKAVDISIVQFAGNAGGPAANIARWMGQLKIPPTPDLVQNTLDHAEPLSVATGQKGMTVDFTGLLGGDMTRTTSIIGAIVSGEDYTVFVKAMGDRDRLLKLKPQLVNFFRTISIAEEKK